jgi:YggT family protein
MREIWLIVNTVAGILAIACILRVWGHKVQLAPRDMLMHFACVVTDWLVKPLRKILPLKPRSLDLAGIVAALIIALLAAVVYNLLLGSAGKVVNPGIAALQAVGWLIEKFLYLLMFVIIGQAILSWVNPNAPVAPSLNLLTRPMLAPIRKVLPAFGGIDFSPLVLIIAVQLLISLSNRVFGSM